MNIKFLPLKFQYVGNGTATATALGAVYTIELRHGDQFQAHVLGVSLGNGTVLNCFDRCQLHLERAITAFIEPATTLAA